MFYFFSTIAQTLAGLFGVTVAFVLFRLAGIESALGDARRVLSAFEHRHGMESGSVWKAALESGSRAREMAGKFYPDPLSADALEIARQIEQVPKWAPVRKKCIGQLRWTAGSMLAAIVLCLFAVPTVPIMSRNVAIASMAGAMSLAVLSLVLLWRLVLGIVRSASIVEDI